MPVGWSLSDEHWGKLTEKDTNSSDWRLFQWRHQILQWKQHTFYQLVNCNKKLFQRKKKPRFRRIYLYLQCWEFRRKKKTTNFFAKGHFKNYLWCEWCEIFQPLLPLEINYGRETRGSDFQNYSVTLTVWPFLGHKSGACHGDTTKASYCPAQCFKHTLNLSLLANLPHFGWKSP